MEQWKNRNLLDKTLYSLNGLRVAVLTEKAVRNEILASLSFVLLAFFMLDEWEDILAVFLASLFPIVIELVNTAVERLIDADFGPVFRDEVRIQKDMLSAAVLLSLVISYGICLKIIFL